MVAKKASRKRTPAKRPAAKKRKPVTIDQSTEVITEIRSLPVVATPDSLILQGMKDGLTTDQLAQLLDLKERHDKNEAKKAYHVALGAFKENPVALTKNKKVKYKNKDGSFTEYKHATLDNVADILGKALHGHGLSFNWKTEQADGNIKVTCNLTHIMGHSESTTLSASPDNSGGKNSIQAVGSTVTYLQRYTLRSITGTAEEGTDDDGAGTEGDERELITEEQSLKIDSMISDYDLDKAAIMAYLKQKLGIEYIADIPADKYKSVVRKINTTIQAKAGREPGEEG